MSSQHRQKISSVFGAEPVLVHSADFGHIHRARLYWGLSLGNTVRKPWFDVYPPGSLANDLWVIRWTGAVTPNKFVPRDGYQ
eukprot:786874-Karenia_brevis.AAC.1